MFMLNFFNLLVVLVNDEVKELDELLVKVWVKGCCIFEESVNGLLFSNSFVGGVDSMYVVVVVVCRGGVALGDVGRLMLWLCGLSIMLISEVGGG